MSDSTLHGLCEAGSQELAAYLEASSARHAATGMRWNVARSLWFEFEGILEQAEEHCREATREGHVDSASCRRTLNELKKVRLDLTALAVDPTGEQRFAEALRRFDALWQRWIVEARALLPALR